jgi:DNA-binding PadR family transcriptional regulator
MGVVDHEIVYVEASIKPRKVNKPPRKVYQYNKANTEELKEKFRNIDFCEVSLFINYLF